MDVGTLRVAHRVWSPGVFHRLLPEPWPCTRSARHRRRCEAPPAGGRASAGSGGRRVQADWLGERGL